MSKIKEPKAITHPCFGDAEITEETLDELSNGKGEDEDDEQ